MTDDQIEHFFKNEFRPIGYVVSEDHEGNLILPERKLQEQWKLPINDVVDFLADVIPDNKLHSIYLRGSASHGNAIEGVSDLDFVLLLRNMYDLQEFENIANQYITKQYPFVKYVEFDSSYLDLLDSYAKWQFKISVLHLYGDNILDGLTNLNLLDVPFPVDGYLFDKAKKSFENDLHIDRCASIMKTIIREFFGLIAHKERVWTRSMYYCFHYFVKNYPEAENVARKIVYLAINPTRDIHIVYNTIDEAADWWKNRGK